jgi:tetratricopeptide (TPR) repeat protein
MKRLAFLVLMLATFSLHAQKAAKPNLNKALKLFQEGKLDEAKAMIDEATTYEKTKDDGKTYYYRALIYSALDTTQVEKFKALHPDPLTVALESFAKADEMGGDKSYSIPGPDGITPITQKQQVVGMANHYINKGAAAYQEDRLEDAVAAFEKTQKIYPNDTTAYFYVGYISSTLDQHDKAIENFKKYIELGGKSPDPYTLMYNMYGGPLDNKEKALEIVKEARAKFPDNPDFPKYEIALLIDLNRVEEAKAGLMTTLEKEPDNKMLHFYLGYINSRMENWDEAKKNLETALKLDPNYFDPQYYLAQIYLIDANKIKEQMNKLGINAADKKKQQELDKILVEKYKIALPYWEKAERLKGDDVDVLDRLRAIYYYLGDDKNEKRILAKQKELGLEN